METPPSATDKAIAAYSFSTHHARMYEEMGNRPTLPTFSVTEPVLSKALFFHLAQLRYAGWKCAVTVRRDRRHAPADVFQDLLAYYLRAALAPHACLVELEASMPGANGGDKTQVDIVIQKKRGIAGPVAAARIQTRVSISARAARCGQGHTRATSETEASVENDSTLYVGLDVHKDSITVPTSAGITQSGSRSRLAHSARSNTGRVSELRYKPVQDFCRTPAVSS